jgi:hypothetical protein
MSSDEKSVWERILQADQERLAEAPNPEGITSRQIAERAGVASA